MNLTSIDAGTALHSAAPSLEDWARATLTTMREQIEADLRAMVREADADMQSCSDEVDRASMHSEQEARFAARAALVKRLAQVDAAFMRLRRGEYGICEITGDDIPEARMRANPLATCTVEAQERIDRRGRFFAS